MNKKEQKRQYDAWKAQKETFDQDLNEAHRFIDEHLNNPDSSFAERNKGQMEYKRLRKGDPVFPPYDKNKVYVQD